MPEFEAVIPGQTGSLFARGDVDSLAVALEYWLRDSHRRAEAANACRSVVARFWNARTQALAISRALRGAEADDLWQFRELHQ
jgi:glycosyltransferase involved in cell wall biosynthesis